MMHEEERNLDRHIENMRKSMQVLLEDPAHKGNLYIAEDDIKEIPCFASAAVAAARHDAGSARPRRGRRRRRQEAVPDFPGISRRTGGCSSCPCTTTWKSGRPPRARLVRGTTVAGRARGRLRLVTRGGQNDGAAKNASDVDARGGRDAPSDRGDGRGEPGRTGRRDAHLATLVRPGLLVLGRG